MTFIYDLAIPRSWLFPFCRSSAASSFLKLFGSQIMQPSMSKSHQLLLIMLLVHTRSGDSVKMNMERRFADSSDPGDLGLLLVEYPYWEDILREFLFKTISPPPPSNNILYKEILEAPLYAGPFPAPEIKPNDHRDGYETAQVLSRGDVYRLPKGGWIICQEGCVDCEICTVQKTATVPTVKWILRRVERVVPFAHPKRHDLQFTVLPQPDGSFHMRNLSPGSYVYVTSNNGALVSFIDGLISGNEEYSSQYPFGTAKSPTSKTSSVVKNEDEGLDREEVEIKKGPETDNEVLQMTSTLIPKSARKRGREVLQGEMSPEKADIWKRIFEQKNLEENSTPLTMFHPPITPTMKSIDDDFLSEKDARLILGRDQFGKKHLVHVVPAGEIDQEINRGSMFSDSRLLHHQPANRHSVHTENQNQSPLYRKLFRRVIDSLNTHKNVIEKFLFSPKRDARFEQGQFLITPSKVSHKEEEPDLKTGKNSAVETSSVDENAENKYANETTENIEEVMEYSEGTSGTTNGFNEEDEVSGEGRRGVLNVTEDQTQESKHHLLHNYFDEEGNYEENFSDELIKRQNNSEDLILKEVAKSLVNHPQGFNSLADTTTLHHETDDSLSTIPKSTTTGNVLYSDMIEKSRRHVLYEY